MEATFGEYIKQKRIDLGFPLRKVASHIDIDPSTLGKIEKDERQLNIEQLDNKTYNEKSINVQYSAHFILMIT
jgi:DNA (cytosine-5)-methyltransferase 1